MLEDIKGSINIKNQVLLLYFSTLFKSLIEWYSKWVVLAYFGGCLVNFLGTFSTHNSYSVVLMRLYHSL